MKKWIQKFVTQLEQDYSKQSKNHSRQHLNSLATDYSDTYPMDKNFSEELATLLYVIDTLSKHSIETDTSPLRRTRETLDDFARNLVQNDDQNLEKTLFRFRQFFSSHRLDEYSYIQKTFDELRKIIWDFIDNLSGDLSAEQSDDLQVSASLEQLREAVESDSIEMLKMQSRNFIDSYIKINSKKDHRRVKRMDTIKKNLSTMKKQLVEANNHLKLDHLTHAQNRRCFDETIKQYWSMHQITKQPITLMMLDIDYFKRINDTYGHPIGDFILVECTKILKEIFTRDVETVSRIGGEEFAIILPDYKIEHAIKKAEAVLSKIRGETFVENEMRINFTVSLGLAQLLEGEPIEHWMKRTDTALYDSKKSGRDRFTIAPSVFLKDRAAS